MQILHLIEKIFIKINHFAQHFALEMPICIVLPPIITLIMP